MVNKSLIKGFSILNVFSREKPELSLAEISRELDMPKPTVLRILNSLEELSFVSKKESGNYTLGVGLVRLSNLVLENMDVHASALPHMRTLSRETDLTIRLLIRNGFDAVLIDKVNPSRDVYVYNMAGIKIRLYNGASARAIFSFLPEEEIKQLLEDFRETDHLSDEQVNSILERTKQEKQWGYSLSFGERLAGTAGMGMPIYDFAGNICGCISIAGLTDDFSDEKVPKLAFLLKEATNRVSKELGKI